MDKKKIGNLASALTSGLNFIKTICCSIVSSGNRFTAPGKAPAAMRLNPF